MIDTHAHLEMSQFDGDREEVIKRAADSGVSLIIDVGSNLKGSKDAVELSRRYDFIYASVGIHPHDVKEINTETYKELERLLAYPKVIAVGEIGLDYYKNHSPGDIQKREFINLLRLAKEFKKPIIVHSRDAGDDTFNILKQEWGSESGGIMHCFSGDEDMAKMYMEMGFYISIAGPVTFPKTEKLRNLVKSIPASRLLIETDCPFLAPQQVRGKRNEPAYVRYVAEKIAEIKGVSIEDIERVIMLNVYNLFNIGITDGSGRITYKIRNSLYLNITNRCTNECSFCTRTTDPYVQGYNLKLEKEPSAEEILKEIGNPVKYDEIVFCGYGEPTLRLNLIKEISKEIKEMGGKIRLNTNGHGNLINKRNILPELKGLVDSISVSLNAENGEKYNKICHPALKNGAYESVKEFIREAKNYIGEVTATIVDMPEVDEEECRRITEKELKVKFRVRRCNVVG
ncbi:MAG: radical SAM protein [Nitrospinae bacterium RIFCSPLOWO2_02_FULL_39_110]|nr:MAG: radical SAM protein [Nitrospinae bacterium RIFCSPHIGHO2_02_39_11]OGW00055.1 MAG: radical SAM protein [Nitrospinae bacterium RIFCSPHIGHO2_12_FULL_39_42]OGW01458.1 MAG: radical SAM protein [Nitrospinae bacterium RIFCSPHIGHO2_02_FULL_39_82]OGW03618.1 MAG: radical SAM protein [Nitrospinae bacterium RIFCSPLOWO2_02_39_17]OGW05596.1 MAG: radical SAM protein [Nitrospinae bacterium RIFCSPLOWO2_02_FULL_39_110]OGW09783.1 MAG: radical SAM protein [Nitrospinae bacterium RIFCSPLOWO2_12_39_15]OGW108